MADKDLNKTTTGTITKEDFSVSSQTLDVASSTNETFWDNTDFPQNLGYYKTIPELKKSVDTLAMYTTGKGWTADSLTTAILDQIIGWGEDSFDSIMQNMIIIKKINKGGSFSEIIRNPADDSLFNLKPLNPETMRTVLNPKGILIRYEELGANGNKTGKKFKPEEILHLVNDRVGNEIHGTDVIEAVKWIIDARNEVMEDLRRVSHLSTLRILYVDVDNPAKLTTIKTQYAEGIKNGTVVIFPGKKGTDIAFEDLQMPPVESFLAQIRYYENFFYQAVGVPKSILGGTADFTEASSKTSVFTFDQVWMTEQRLLEQDIWNQLGLRVKFNRPTSLKDNIVQDEAANTGQLGFQPNETEVGVTRNE